jgi:membrane-associated phospholipid phosphatase
MSRRVPVLLPRVLASSLVFGTMASSAESDTHSRAGDVLRVAMPVGVVTYEVWRGDNEGLEQFGMSWAATLAATEILKRATHVERPDGSDDLSFPSGHASNAFVAATYMHRRHGFEQAWPLYLAATYVGWNRVQADRHRWADIAGSAALAGVFSWWLVTPEREPAVIVIPSLLPGLVSLQMRVRW